MLTPSILVVCLALAISGVVVDGFVVTTPRTAATHTLVASSSSSTEVTPATLRKSTTWKLRLVLEDAANQNPTTTLSMTGQFLDDEGYEPPQGTFVLKEDEESKVRIKASRWMLSEDPDDRKDGLWIWGLFRFESCFPFLLLTLELQDLTEEDPETMRFYARVPHTKAEDGHVALETAPLQLQRLEQMNADPMGFAKVEILDSVPVGRISFFPVNEE